MMMKKILLLILLLGCLSVTCWAESLPKLLDIGADNCIPCIKMAPILEQLEEDFAGRMEVQFIDAWKNRDEAANYGVRMIPTQIFFAPGGKELYRHTGFYSREDILTKWQELGFSFAGNS